MDSSRRNLFSLISSFLQHTIHPAHSKTQENIKFRHFLFLTLGFLAHLLFFLLFSNYTSLFLLFNGLFHCWAALVLWKKSIYDHFYQNILTVYFVLAGPAAIQLCNGFFSIAYLGASMTPCFVFLLTRKLKFGVILLVVEMLKCSTIYPHLLREVIMGYSKHEILEMLEQDFMMLGLLIPIIFLVFSILFKQSVKTFHEFENVKAELQKTNAELKLALEERESFILSFSHEVRNPLNSVLGNVELAYEETHDIKIKEKLKNSKICGDMLLSLINNLLDVAKAGMGKLEVHPKECEFIPIFKKVWTVCREIIRSRKLLPVLELNGDFPEKVMLDHYRLMQILFNLIGNAVKFTEQGEVKLRITWVKVNSQGVREEFGENQEEMDDDLPREPFFENKRLKNVIKQETLSHYNSFESLPPISDEGVAYSHRKPPVLPPKQFKHNLSDIDKGTHFNDSSAFGEGNGLDDFAHIQTFEARHPGVLRIEVIDTGIGISKEDQKKLFQKFTQFSKNSDKSKIGTGLGLWITKEICKKMGGQIEVFSDVGQGTTFRVELNCDSCFSSKQTLDPKALHLGPKQLGLFTPLRALIVEDDFFNADVLDMFFQRFNIEVVRKVKNGVDAVKCFEDGISQDNLINIVTLDLNMPLMDGRTACTEIRKLEKRLNLPPAIIIIISGSTLKTDFEVDDKSKEYAPNYYLKKPVKKRDFDELMVKVINELSVRKYKISPKRKTLLFNDGEFGLKFMAEMLSYRNVHSILVDEVDEAFERYKKDWKEIGLVLMDYDTSSAECLELSKRIQIFCKNNKTRVPSIYYLSNRKTPHFVEKCKEAGILKVLLKPIHFQTLIRKIAPEDPLSTSFKI